MPALNRSRKVMCEKVEYKRSDAAIHRKRCENKDEHKCPNCNFVQEEGRDESSCCEDACSTKFE